MSEIFSAIVRHHRADLLVRASDSHLLGVDFLPFKNLKPCPNAIARSAACELERYFDGQEADFSPFLLAFPAATSAFARSVYEALLAVPYGARWPYKELAFCIGTRAYQAVGAALSRNPFMIILPCHRIVRSDRDLGGYSAWRERAISATSQRARAAKEALITMEQAFCEAYIAAQTAAKSPVREQFAAQKPANKPLIIPPQAQNFHYIL